ncbi:MAG: uroporphyrinogen-III synthase, partial [Planctomycetales bacterium]|nr:uroporphyrinogen-III synthase [Planctomycetales bacterium]
MTSNANFNGLVVASFESRRAEEMTRLIERHGGRAIVAPSMREVSLDDNAQAVDFAQRVIAGQIDVAIFMTGVGFGRLMTAVEKQVDRESFLASLSAVTTLARGPKTVAAMREVGLAPTHKVPEPNTWREILALLDEEIPVAGRTAAVLEYGVSNPNLVAGLEARGAKVQCVKVYNWELPLDTAPLADSV